MNRQQTSRRITFRRGRIRRHSWQREQPSTYFTGFTEKEYRTWWKCEHCDRSEATYDGNEPRGKYIPKCKLRY